MTPYELKRRVEATGSNFFARSSMRFFGDTMRNYGVRAQTQTVSGREVWVLYRKHPVKHGLDKDAYFDVSTFERVHDWEGMKR